jgi:hypothetical protein
VEREVYSAWLNDSAGSACGLLSLLIC